MLLGSGLCVAGQEHATPGEAACAGPGRAITGGVHWGVRSVCAGGVGARPIRCLYCRVSAGRDGRGWASGVLRWWNTLLLFGWNAGETASLRVA